MPSFNRYCDIMQGYNLRQDVQTPIGFITSLKVGDTTLKADQTCKDPMSPESDVSVFAVLSGVSWEVGITDAIMLSGQISNAQRKSVMLLTYKDMSKVDVTFQFTIYDYDPIEKKYFKCMLPTDDAKLNGLLEKNGDDLNIAVADEPSHEVQSPLNYSFQIGIKPQTKAAQQVTIAASFTDKVVKPWGLKVG